MPRFGPIGAGLRVARQRTPEVVEPPRGALCAGEIAIVKHLAAQGQSADRISKTLRRSHQMVSNAMKRLGFQRKDETKLTLTLPKKLLSYLEGAAKRRRVKTDELAAKMLEGVLRNATIDGITRGLFQIDR
jgi:hypothetical protein